MERKKHIIETYLKLGSKKGFGSVSLSDIALEEGITKASLFSHFANYDTLRNEAEQYCINLLQEKEISVDFSAQNAYDVMVNLVNSFIDTFSNPVLNCYLEMLNQMKGFSRRIEAYSKQIDSMIAARITIALDYCVQRSWSHLNDTDSIAVLLTPYIRTLLTQNANEDELDEVLRAFVSVI